jgi:hypothetical protein
MDLVGSSGNEAPELGVWQYDGLFLLPSPAHWARWWAALVEGQDTDSSLHLGEAVTEMRPVLHAHPEERAYWQRYPQTEVGSGPPVTEGGASTRAQADAGDPAEAGASTPTDEAADTAYWDLY